MVLNPVYRSVSGTTDNLKKDMFDAFAMFLANVTRTFRDVHGIEFDSITPLNEAANGWWKDGGSQEA